MIVSTLLTETKTDISVEVWPHASTEPIIIHLAQGNYVHLSVAEASRLHLQLTAALYEYEEKS